MSTADTTRWASDGGAAGNPVRAATPGDRAAAVAVWLRADAARGVARGAGEVDYVWARLADPDSIVLVAEADDGRVTGMALVEPGRADGGRGAPIAGLAHIGMVFVDPDHWGRGIGGRLLDGLLAAARAAGYVRAQLWVREGNERARRLYAGRGFAPEGTTGRDDHGEPILLLVRTL